MLSIERTTQKHSGPLGLFPCHARKTLRIIQEEQQGIFMYDVRIGQFKHLPGHMFKKRRIPEVKLQNIHGCIDISMNDFATRTILMELFFHAPSMEDIRSKIILVFEQLLGLDQVTG
jgi:hypothetical protein